MKNPGVFTSSADPIEASGYKDCFSSDDSTYTVTTDGNELKLSSHEHDFAYSATGATITATCTATGCTLTANPTLTIVKPTLETYGETGQSGVATLTGLDAFNTATSSNVAETDVKYVGRDGTTYAESATAPTNAGKYTAKLTLSGVKTSAGDNQSVTASVDYEIAKAATTVTAVPAAGEITYGQTLADSTLTGGEASVAGGFAWKDSALAPAVSDSQETEYDVVFTPPDGNYAAAECKAKLTVNKADSKVTKTPEATNPTYNGNAQKLVTAGKAEGGTMQYSLDDKTFSEKVPTGTDAKAYTVWYKVVGDANHNDTEAKSVTSTITPTPAPEPAPAATVAKAAKPKTVAYPSKSRVDVSWRAAKGAKTYQLQWRKAGAKKWTTVSAKGKSKTVTGLKAGACYEFRVRGVNGKVRGKWSSASLRWLKGAAKAKAATGKSGGSVKATWRADKAATGGFKVFVYSKRGGKVVATKTVKAGATSATVKGLKSGKTYYVRVRPYRAQGGSTYYGAISGYRAAKAK